MGKAEHQDAGLNPFMDREASPFLHLRYILKRDWLDKIDLAG